MYDFNYSTNTKKDFFKNKYEELINCAVKEKRGLKPEPGYEIHHIIPKYIFRRKGLEIDNSEKNLVKLTVSEHIKAHQYWALYTEDPDACMAFVFLYGKQIKKENIEEVTDEEIQEISYIREISNSRNRGKGNPMYGKEPANKGKHMSEEQKIKISKALLGHKVSDATRKKISEKNKGRQAHNKGKPMPQYLKDNLSKKAMGRKMSEETKQKIREGNIGKKKPGRSLSLKGTHWYNNGIIQVQIKECPEGFVPGKLKLKN